MTSLSDCTRAPIAFDPTRGQEAVELFPGAPENVARLIAGAAGCSPYLDHLLRREHDWLATVLGDNLDPTVRDILDAIGGESFNEVSQSLRTAKRRTALVVALADLGGLWSLDQVTGALSDLQDRAVQAAMTHLVGAEIARGKVPGCTEADLHDCAGLVAISMGKGGARELNYSSDIDLIMLFDETRHAPENFAEVRSAFIRVVQRMVKLLQENTEGGYVFRVDLRLRPDPSVTPVCIAMDAAERYYESLGRTWERAAFIKARACAGATEAGTAFLERLVPFVWRRHLDFAAIKDAHDMRLRIREHKGLGGPITIPGHDMKLGRGGIREIEFFTQTRQLICGGRDPKIRQRDTRPALAALAAQQWIPEDIAKTLSAAYVEHRTVEHRLQMLEDQQTQSLPTDPEKMARLAAFCGWEDADAFAGDVRERLQVVHDLTEKFFAGDEQPPTVKPIGEYGFVRPEAARDLMDGWPDLPAMRSERARDIFKRLEPEILTHLSSSANPDEALLNFHNFLSGLPAGVQVFSLFEATPKLLDLVIDICATTPELGRYLGRNAGALDYFLGRDFYDPLPGVEALSAELQGLMPTDGDYEEILNVARRWVKEMQFRIGVHLLRKISTAAEAARTFSDVAEACVIVLYPQVCAHFAERHGPPPGLGAAIIAMGKLGSQEMTATSDLDLIVVYDAGGETESTGTKPLPISTYFARLTQAMVSALTVPTSEGALYKVDMRLRPSGRQGPVATSITAFANYQREEAWTWEHLALTRARVIAGEQALTDAANAAISAAIRAKHDSKKVLKDVAEMRRRLAEAKADAESNPWEVKFGPGRLMDIELFLQAGILVHGTEGPHRPTAMLAPLEKAGWVTPAETEVLRDALVLFSTVQQLARLAVEGTLASAKLGRGPAQLLLDGTGTNSIAELEELLRQTATRTKAILDRAVGGDDS